jgi:hypothetical protein
MEADPSPSVEGDGSVVAPPNASVGPCPAAAANESVYCQFFDTRASTREGPWSVQGEPTVGDSGLSSEDNREFWSAPTSRRLGWDDELYARVTGPLPVKRVVVTFRFRPDYAPSYGPRHLGFATLGDVTTSIVWGDYGKFDASRAGTNGYALVHHVFGSSVDRYAPLPRFVTPKIWSAIELSLDASGVATLAFDGTPVASVSGPATASTSCAAGLGPYFTSSSGSPTALSGNVDDFVVRVAR